MVRTYAKVVGIVIILIGVVGLIAGEEPGLFNIEIADNILHLALGVFGIAVAWLVRDTARVTA